MEPVASAPTFFFIRHGETAWNREGRLQGQHDVPLNPLGQDQAAAVGRTLKTVLRKHGIDEPTTLRFVASPLGRARQTMEIARRALGLDPGGYELEDQIKELAFGDWEGKTWAELKASARDLVRQRRQDKWSFVPPGGESYAQLAERLRGWLPSVRQHDVVVAHGGVARVLLVLLAGVSTDRAPETDIWQGRVLTFASGKHRWD